MVFDVPVQARLVPWKQQRAKASGSWMTYLVIQEWHGI